MPETVSDLELTSIDVRNVDASLIHITPKLPEEVGASGPSCCLFVAGLLTWFVGRSVVSRAPT